jgi:hypothetical protein
LGEREEVGVDGEVAEVIADADLSTFGALDGVLVKIGLDAGLTHGVPA